MVGMPLYEYECRSCNHQFELLVRESTKLACPQCAATELSKQLSVFAVSGPSPHGRAGRLWRLRRSARRRQLLELRGPMRATCILFVAIVATASTFALGASTVARQTPFTPQPIPTPAAANSSQPQLSVSKRGVLVSWIERAGDLATLKFAERTATGWTAAQTIASGRDWFVNWADVPSALRLPSGAIVAHWLQKSSASTYAYDVRLSYSTDDGKTWSKSFTPHHDGTPTEHGFASLFAMGDGFGLVWLDGRAMKADGHGEHGAGAMSVRFALRSQIHTARRIRGRRQGLRVLPDDSRGHRRRHHHRVSQSQRRRNSRQLCRAAGQWQVVHAGAGV